MSGLRCLVLKMMWYRRQQKVPAIFGAYRARAGDGVPPLRGSGLRPDFHRGLTPTAIGCRRFAAPERRDHVLKAAHGFTPTEIGQRPGVVPPLRGSGLWPCFDRGLTPTATGLRRFAAPERRDHVPETAH